MSKQKDDFSKDVESIFKKTVEINKHYLKQSTELVKEFGQSGGDLKKFNLLKPEILLGAFTSFTKMNLDHYKNMMDLGFALSRKAFSSAPERPAEDDDKSEEPSFVLSATSHAGEVVALSFLLDNVKSEEVVCHLVHSEYTNEETPSLFLNLPTKFHPQAFRLASGITQKVDIEIAIHNDVKFGIYQSKVQVIGFEPAYFLIRLTIKDKPVQKAVSKPSKTTENVRQKTQRNKPK